MWSFVYLALRRVLGLLVLRAKTERAKDLELVGLINKYARRAA